METIKQLISKQMKTKSFFKKNKIKLCEERIAKEIERINNLNDQFYSNEVLTLVGNLEHHSQIEI